MSRNQKKRKGLTTAIEGDMPRRLLDRGRLRKLPGRSSCWLWTRASLSAAAAAAGPIPPPPNPPMALPGCGAPADTLGAEAKTAAAVEERPPLLPPRSGGVRRGWVGSKGAEARARWVRCALPLPLPPPPAVTRVPVMLVVVITGAAAPVKRTTVGPVVEEEEEERRVRRAGWLGCNDEEGEAAAAAAAARPPETLRLPSPAGASPRTTFMRWAVVGVLAR
jgi:hypothetical protein